MSELGSVGKSSVKAEGSEILYKGVTDCLMKILRNEGIRGFYKGFLPNLLRVVPSNGLFFLIYENVLKLLHQL